MQTKQIWCVNITAHGRATLPLTRPRATHSHSRPARAQRQLRALVSFLGGGDGGSGTEEVIRDFEGGTAPPFVAMTFNEACADANARSAPFDPTYLLVYLHSAAHPDTASFRDILCSPDFRALCSERDGTSSDGASGEADAARAAGRRCVLWGSDVSRRDGFAVASEVLKVTRYPYLAVLFVEGARVQAICMMEGATELEGCVQRVRDVTAGHRASLQGRRVQRAESDRRRELMLAQDREANESARHDRERAEQRRAEEEAEREAAEAEREAAELRDALALSDTLAQRASVAAAQQRLGAEPAAGDGESILFTVTFRASPAHMCTL